MKKTLAFIAALGIAALSSGCGSTLGGGFPDCAQTQVKLQEGNYKIVKTNATGYSSGWDILFFITLSDATYTEAMSDLYTKNNIMTEGRPQTLINVIQEHQLRSYFIVNHSTTNIRADVIEFIPDQK